VAFVPCVDTAPVLEREAASASGIGFQAKNTMLIAPGLGSFVLLGELLTDLECAPGPLDGATPRCGACTRCLDVCPFNAPDLQGTRATGAPELAPRPGYGRPSLVRLLGLGAAQFRKWQA